MGGNSWSLNFILQKDLAHFIVPNSPEQSTIFMRPEDATSDALSNSLAKLRKEHPATAVELVFRWDLLDYTPLRIYDIPEIALVIIEKVCSEFHDAEIRVQEAHFNFDGCAAHRRAKKLPPTVRSAQVTAHHFMSFPGKGACATRGGH